MLAEQNVATLNGYKEQGGMKTDRHDLPALLQHAARTSTRTSARKLEVVHHTDFLLGLLAEKKLVPRKKVEGKVVYHDRCYLGRYNDVYESPREILKRIPGVELVEAEYWNQQKGLCCGAGGAQMWMEEQNKDRVNVKRTLQLVDTGAKTIASGCPFCLTMLTDGLKAHLEGGGDPAARRGGAARGELRARQAHRRPRRHAAGSAARRAGRPRRSRSLTSPERAPSRACSPAQGTPGDPGPGPEYFRMVTSR